MKIETRPDTTCVASAAALERIGATSVAVLMGGGSSEREVSLWSGAAVLGALRAAPETGERRGPARVHAVELAPDGRWIVEGRAQSALEALDRLGGDCLYFLALHGGKGEDGTIQGLLEALGRAHTGSGVEASALCMNKQATRLVLREAGVSVARGRLVLPGEWRARRSAVLEELARLSTSGYSVKPNRGGSSVATALLDGPELLAPSVEAVFATGDDALVEQRIRGAESTCGVLGNRGAALRALPPVEIVPKAGRFFDYEEKYSKSGAEEHCPPRSLEPHTVERIRELACRAYGAAGCDGYARIDFMIPRANDGAVGEPVALEINTLPGMTARSLLPLAAGTEGLSFRRLCLEILGLALDRAAARAGWDA